jgi:alkylhydroperoxidase/carboxymuconolactone decarboxylase family protein YurZ
VITPRQSTLLRRIALGDARALGWLGPSGDPPGEALDPRTSALIRIGTLVALGADPVTYQREVDGALRAGATPDEVVEVLHDIAPVVGSAAAIAAAPRIALALGYDLDRAFEELAD